MSVYVTGDTHGDFERVQKFCEERQLTAADTLLTP